MDEHSFAAEFDRLVSDAPTSLLSDSELDAEFDKIFNTAPSCLAAPLDPVVEGVLSQLEHVRIHSV